MVIGDINPPEFAGEQADVKLYIAIVHSVNLCCFQQTLT